MRSNYFGRECLRAFQRYARSTPEGRGIIDLGIADSLGGKPRNDEQGAKRKLKNRPPVEPD